MNNIIINVYLQYHTVYTDCGIMETKRFCRTYMIG